MQDRIVHDNDLQPQLDSYLTASPFDEIEATTDSVDSDIPIVDDDGYNEDYIQAVTERKQRGTFNPFDSLSNDERDDYNEWTDAQKAETPLPQPQDFARRLYPDLDVWEVPSYGRVWQNREGTYSHNGPAIGLLKLSYEDRDDAIQNLIDCVHKQLDHNHAIQFDRDASLGYYGGVR